MTITYMIGNTLYLNITNRCSNACEFCIRNNGSGVGDANSLWLEREPSKEEIVADIFKRDIEKYDEIVFCGYGEPLERLDDVVYICRKIKEKFNVKIRINTNGQADLIYGRKTAGDLLGLVDAVSISLNAPDAAGYQKLCHSAYGEKSFEAIIAYAKDCKKYIPEVVFSVVDVIPKADIEKCRSIAESAGVEFRVRAKID